MKRVFLLIMLLVVFHVAVAGEPRTVSIAFLSIDNLSKDPKYDYLEGIIQGLLLFDLTNQQEINVVERRDLNRVLDEQKLILSGVIADTGTALEVGKLLGAQYLLKGGYVFLGEDVLINLTLVDVPTGKTYAFSQRGNTENTIHALSEQLILRLTGKEIILQSQDKSRSIISLKDETPGSIALFCRLIDAEIFVDEEFLGYTPEDTRVPFEIKNLSPGIHTLRVHLAGGFGVIKLPEFTFHDWEEKIKVQPGKRIVVRSNAADFNSQIYDQQKLISESLYVNPQATEPVTKEYTLAFTDRKGKKIPIHFQIKMRAQGADLRIHINLTYMNKEHSFEYTASEKTKLKEKTAVGLTTLTVSVTRSFNDYRVEYSLLRNDIRQNMYNK